MAKKTIYALSTFFGQSAVAIVRISGTQSHKVASKLCNLKKIKPRYAHFCKLHDKKGEVFDEAIAIFFKSPISFTGEDVLEIHTHGGIYVIKKLMDELAKFTGLQMAKPGEFSERSFLNQKRNLIYFEGINNLISAESEKQLNIAKKQVFSLQENPVQKWKDKIQESKAILNAEIEFFENFNSQNNIKKLKINLSSLKMNIDNSIILQNTVKQITHGHRVAVVGPVNSGKSSLINYLFQDDKSIISKYEGTTTDHIEHSLILEGEKVTFVDSAGVRDSDNFIEKQGIKKTFKTLESENNFILVVSPDVLVKKKLKIIQDLIVRFQDKKFIIVLNKIDMPNSVSVYKEFKKTIKKKKNLNFFELSCLKDSKDLEKLEILKKFIYLKLLKTEASVKEDLFFTELRHYDCLKKASHSLNLAIENLLEGEIAANFLDEVLLEFDNILGRHDSDEELDIIFRKFCIGK